MTHLIRKVELPAGSALIGKVGIDQTTPGTTNKVVASGLGYHSQITLTRTADTNAYTAGDAIGVSVSAGGAVLTFTNMGAAAGDIMITDADLLVAVASVPSGMTSFRLHLYNATPPGNLADNAAWDLPSGDRASYLGYIDLGTPVDVGSTLFVQTGSVNKKIRLGASTSLFAYLVTNGGYTPSSAAVKLIRLNAVGI